MKRIGLVVFLLFIGINVNAQSKIGTIDAEYILSQMPANTEIQKGLEEYNKELQGDLESSIKDYEAMVKDYQANSEGLEEEARKTKESKIVELENNIKGFRQKASVMMQMKRNELTNPLYEKIDAAMKQVIQKEGYTQVFHAGSNGLAFSRKDDDITEKVMNIMGIEPKQPVPTNNATTVQDEK